MASTVESTFQKLDREYVRIEMEQKNHMPVDVGLLFQVSGYVRNLMNQDVCMTENQQEFVDRLVFAAAMQVDKGVNIDVEVMKIVTLANSFRLECENCLNKGCENRDSEKAA